jgi:hypothetical protein
VTAVRRTPDDWDEVVARMQTRGAKMTNAERQATAAYLAENFALK